VPKRREFLLGSVAWLATVAASRSALAQAPSPGLRTYLAGEMRKARIPGMQIAVVRQERIEFLEHFGLADIENAVPVTGATVFQIASLTKAFVGVAVMQLLESGKLDLGDPVSRHLEELPVPWRSVTVGQLATHTSGLPDIVADITSLRLVVDGDAEASWERVRTMPMASAPGERFDYNQTNYVLLGRIIDRLAGEPFARFLRPRQFEVAGMTRTVFGDDHDVVPHSARTYTPYLVVDGQLRRTDVMYKVHTEFPPMLRTCGGMNSTAEDIARWLIALQRGELLRRRSNLVGLRTALPLNDGSPGPWGIGGRVIARRSHPVFYGVGAAKAAFGVYPQDDLALVVLTNLSADMGLPFLDGIAAQFLPDLQAN